MSRAALLGLACGLRTFVGPGALALRGRVGDERLRHLLIACAAGELIADKTPLVPRRTWWPSLAARMASGALCGRALDAEQGPITGAAGAVVGSFAGYHARTTIGRRTGCPPILLGMLEDAVAVAVASVATDPRFRRQG